METELWKDILGFEGLYKISDQGRVLSLRRKAGIRTQNESYLVGFIDKWGYHQILLRKDGKAHHAKRHILVAKHFIPNPENKRTVNHKFGDKADNRAVALEWATYSEQHKHAFAVLKRVHPKLGDRNKVIKSSKVVIKLVNGVEVSRYTSLIAGARDNNLKSQNIHAACLGKTKTCGGFNWKYEN